MVTCEQLGLGLGDKVSWRSFEVERTNQKKQRFTLLKVSPNTRGVLVRVHRGIVESIGEETISVRQISSDTKYNGQIMEFKSDSNEFLRTNLEKFQLPKLPANVRHFRR